MIRNLALALASLALCWGASEGIAALLLARGRALPLVKFHTEQPGVELWAYDDHFRSRADFDLRRETPYRNLRYCCNEDRDPALDGLAPERVPHAVEVRFSPQATRERDWREVVEGARVAVVAGDSFCFGQGVRQRDRMSDRLERRLAPAAEARGLPPWALLAMCYCGADVEGVERAVREFSALPNVRRVIYAYVLNDPVQDAELREMEQTLDDFMHRRRQVEAEAAVDGAATPLLRWFAARRLQQQVARRTIAWYHALHRGPSWERAERGLVSMQALLAERGIEFVLVIFPLFHDFDDYPFLALHRQLLDTAARHGIRAIDLWPAFAGTDETTWWVHPKDFHPNHRAHEVAAEVLARELAW